MTDWDFHFQIARLSQPATLATGDAAVAVIAFPFDDRLAVRRFNPRDALATFRVFREAVLHGASGSYGRAERMAWAPSVVDLADWARRRGSHPTWVAERQDAIVGFADLTAEGEVRMVYVRPDQARTGVGLALLQDVERCAREADMPRLHAKVSLNAEPLFERTGFTSWGQEWVRYGEESLVHIVMQKVLEPTP